MSYGDMMTEWERRRRKRQQPNPAAAIAESVRTQPVPGGGTVRGPAGQVSQAVSNYITRQYGMPRVAPTRPILRQARGPFPAARPTGRTPVLGIPETAIQPGGQPGWTPERAKAEGERLRGFAAMPHGQMAEQWPAYARSVAGLPVTQGPDYQKAQARYQGAVEALAATRRGEQRAETRMTWAEEDRARREGERTEKQRAALLKERQGYWSKRVDVPMAARDVEGLRREAEAAAGELGEAVPGEIAGIRESLAAEIGRAHV